MADKIGPEFMLKTQYQNMGESDQQKGLPQPPLELPVDPALPCIALPDPASITTDTVSLRALIEQRRTLRQYSEQSLSLAELSYLLWCTQGIRPDSPPNITRRNVPSAGSRHPFETLLLINRVAGLEPGLYRYVASQHALAALVVNDTIVHEITRAAENQAHVRHCAVAFIWVAVAERTVYRYQERGYRYMHLDAGHVCQNLYLAAEALGCGVCAIAAFNDADLNAVLHLDGEAQFVIYMGTVGKRA